MSTEIQLIFWLSLCHFLADYTHLSTKWMLDAKRLGTPLTPILAHACVHGVLMFTPLAVFLGLKCDVVVLVWFQIATHFVIDTLKGRLNCWIPKLQSQANKWHWVVFGADQFFHFLIILTMVHFVKLSTTQ